MSACTIAQECCVYTQRDIHTPTIIIKITKERTTHMLQHIFNYKYFLYLLFYHTSINLYILVTTCHPSHFSIFLNWGWRDESVVQSTHCFYRGTEFGSSTRAKYSTATCYSSTQEILMATCTHTLIPTQRLICTHRIKNFKTNLKLLASAQFLLKKL